MTVWKPPLTHPWLIFQTVLRDTARLSQRYPHIARYGGFGVSTWPMGCDTPSPFSSQRFPLGEHAKYPLCDTISQKGIARWGGISHWAAKCLNSLASRDPKPFWPKLCVSFCSWGGDFDSKSTDRKLRQELQSPTSRPKVHWSGKHFLEPWVERHICTLCGYNRTACVAVFRVNLKHLWKRSSS